MTVPPCIVGTAHLVLSAASSGDPVLLTCTVITVDLTLLVKNGCSSKFSSKVEFNFFDSESWYKCLF